MVSRPLAATAADERLALRLLAHAAAMAAVPQVCSCVQQREWEAPGPGLSLQ